MTVSSTNSKHIYNGNGVTVNWPYTFTIINTTDIKVYLTNTDAEVSEITTGFTVDELNNRVVYPAVGSGIPVLPTGWKITLVREMDLTQLLDLTRQGPLDSESLEEAYDKLTLIAQQHDEQISRCIIWAIDSTPSTVDTTAYLEQIQAERTAAETAATAAETAQGLAETAQAAAETAQGLAETAETNAETAQTAAELAETNAELAQAAAESARDLALGYRDAASGYATTATTQASAASGFATTATTQAGIATTQAANALSSAQDAETAKTAAETAQGLAEDAQDAAETAQGLAEDARDTAVTAKDDAVSAQGLAEDAKDAALLAQTAAESARDLASGYKDTATTQAGLATSAKDDAVIAKTAAETAQGLAEDAKDDAVIAKNAAEAAAALLATGTFDNELTLKEIATPATPSAGYKKFYAKTDGKVYTKDSAGNEIEVGSGGGSGGINYIDNSDFETDVAGWSTYADAAGESPVDGTGSSANITFTRNTSSPLRGNGDGLITKDSANRQGEGISYDFTIDAADYHTPMTVSFDYLASANFSYANEDLRIFVYSKDGTALVPVTPNTLDGSGHFIGEFQTEASPNNDYRLIFHIATTNANAWTFQIDNVKCGPTAFIYGNLQDRQYNLTVTGTNYTSKLAKGIPYKTQDGTWRLKFNISGNTSPGASSLNLTFSGVTFKASENAYNTIAASLYGGTPLYAYTNPGTSTITIACNTGASIYWGASGDVELDSMPTWATDFYPVQYGDQYDGRVVACTAHRNGSNQTGVNPNNSVVQIQLNSVATTNNEVGDTHGGFDVATYGYTIKVSGKYKLDAGILILSTNILVNYYRLIVRVGSTFAGGTDILSIESDPRAATDLHITGSKPFNFVAGDKIWLGLYGAGNNSVNTLTISGNSKETFLSLTKDAGASTVSASEKVNCRYEGNAGQNLASQTILLCPTRIYSSHNNIYNPTTGEITLPVSGKYLVRASSFVVATATSAGQSVYVFLYTGATASSGTIKIGTVQTAGASGLYTSTPFLEGTVCGVKGDIFSIQVLSDLNTSRAIATEAYRVWIEVTKID